MSEPLFALIAVGHDTAEDCVVLVSGLDVAPHPTHTLYITRPHKSLGVQA
jgi:hypothetical protein